MRNVNIIPVLDTRYKRKDNKFPLRIRVTFGHDWIYVHSGLYVTEHQYKQLPKKEASDLKYQLARAETIARDLKPFHFDAFKRKFMDEPEPEVEKAPDVFTAFERRIENLRHTGKESTADWYAGTLINLRYHKKSLEFSEINTAWVEKYVNWLKQPKKYPGHKKEMKGCGKTTISLYLRALQAIINRGIAEGYAKSSPFGRYKYTIPQGQSTKRDLTMPEITKLWKFVPPTTEARRGKAFWFFIYLGNGINAKDVALLKKTDIKGEYIVFVRAKTEQKNNRPIYIYITPELRQIMKEYGGDSDHIFPILTEPANAARTHREIKNFRENIINKWMQQIAKTVGIDKPITSYYGRHSYATRQIESDEPIYEVSKSMGHTNIKTTMRYDGANAERAAKRMAGNLLISDKKKGEGV